MADDDVLEGEVVEEAPRTLVPVMPTHQALTVGTAAIAALSDEQFEENLAMMRKGLARAQRIQKELLVEGRDYGKVPNVEKPFLHKAGAEIFNSVYGLAVDFAIKRVVGDNTTAPMLSYEVRAPVHLGNLDGPIVAVGVGEANSWEIKHRYRYEVQRRKCPDCGSDTIIKLREEKGGNWWCGTRDGGCGHSFRPSDPKGQAIAAQPAGRIRVENPDPYELANTLVKMGKKRAYVDGILTATASSGLFTQDEESVREIEAEAETVIEGTARPVPAERGQTRTSEEPPHPAGSAAAGGASEFQGKVIEAPDGIRQAKSPDGVLRERFEIKFKVGTSKHTAILYDDDARRAMALKLRADDEIIVTGRLHREPWEKDGRQVPERMWMKQVLDVTDIRVADKDGWVSWRGQAPAANAAPPPPAPEPEHPNVAAAREIMGDDMLDFAPEPPAAAPVARWEDLPWAPVEDGQIVELRLCVDEIKLAQTDKGGKYAQAKLRTLERPAHRYKAAAMGEFMNELLGEGGNPVFAAGEVVQILGAIQRDWIIISAVAAAV